MTGSEMFTRARTAVRENGPVWAIQYGLSELRTMLGWYYYRGIRLGLNRLYRVTDALQLTDPTTVYSAGYYRKRRGEPHHTDARIFAAAVEAEFAPDSVIDLGCAIGHYLRPLYDRGVDVHGVDGHPAALTYAVIPESRLDIADLREPYHPPQRFDVALCIEVAEHLAPRYAETLVDTLARSAPVIVFTAAPPGQGGTHHVNEQPRGYWTARFADRGFGYDAETTAALQDRLDGVELTHVPENLFVFREGTA